MESRNRRRVLIQGMLLTSVCLLALYAYLVPKGPDLTYSFMHGAKRKASGISKGGDMAPAVMEFGTYELLQPYEDVLLAVKAEFRGTRFLDASNTKVRALVWYRNGTDYGIEGPNPRDHQGVVFTMARGLSNTPCHRIQLALFGPKARP